MKKTLALLLAMMMVIGLFAGCGQEAEPTVPATDAPTEAPTEAEEEPVELIVFAAASMTETLTELGDQYMADHPEVSIVFNFDSSGTLKSQIQEGADVDIFISAGQKQMNQLDITADTSINTDGLDFVLEGTRFNILENKVALAVPEGNPAGINSYDDLITGLKDASIMLAMGNADVPVGQYTQKILTYFELVEEDLAAAGSITYGSNVKEVTTQVSEATVDCGIIYEVFRMSDSIAVMDAGRIERIGSRGAVFADPQTRKGAILTGCKNVSSIERLENGQIWATDWDMVLTVPNLMEDTTAVGVRMKTIRPGPGENSYRCRVVEVIENPFSYTIMLEPLNSQCTVPIGWELLKKDWEILRADEVGIHIPTEAVLLLRDK